MLWSCKSGLSLSPIEEEPAAEDFHSDVKCDLLTSHDSQDVTTTSGSSFIYSDLKVPVGSVRSVYAFKL